MLTFTTTPKLFLVAILLLAPCYAPILGFTAPALAQSSNPGTQAETLLEQAVGQAEQRKYQQAVQTAQQALAIYQELKNRRGEGLALKTLTTIYVDWGFYGEAIATAGAALKIGLELEDVEIIVDSFPLLGRALGNNGEYGSALEIYQTYVTFLQELKAQIPTNQAEARQQVYAEEGSALNTLGTIYSVLGQYDKAIDYYQQGLRIAQAVKNRPEEAENLFRLAIAYGMKEDQGKAEFYLNQVEPIIDQLQSPNGKAAVLSIRGAIAYYLNNNPEQAIAYYRQSLAIAEELSDPQLLQDVLLNGGTILTAQEKYPEAIAALLLAAKVADTTSSNTSAVEIANALAVAYLRAGQFQEAEEALQISVVAAEKIRSTFQSSNTTANDINKVSLFDTQAQTYDLLQQGLIAQNRPEEALEIAERGRARAFIELLGSRVQGQQLQSQNYESAIKPIKFEEIKQIAKDQKATLVQYSIIYDDLKGRGKPKARESELFIWVVQPTGEINFQRVDLKPLSQQASLASLVAVSRESIGVRGLSFQENNNVINQILQTTPVEQNQRLQLLYKLLIEPIAALLPTDPTERVIFVPQGPLFGVPFPALQDANGKYLIDQHTVAIAPAIQVLGLTRQQRQKIQQAGLKDKLVMGNPVMPSIPPRPGEKPRQLTALPGAEREAKAIATILNTQPVLGKQATKATIIQRMKQARMIHLATHGLLEDFSGSGVPGAIALAPDGKQKSTALLGSQEIDGLLTSTELLQLKLNAELVVLSACDTGGGKITGDGVIGLSRAFIIAGVPSVVVSLWQVPDAPTADLMTHFYRNLQKNQDKATALRQAMLETRKSYPDPKAWAAFTLIGEAE